MLRIFRLAACSLLLSLLGVGVAIGQSQFPTPGSIGDITYNNVTILGTLTGGAGGLQGPTTLSPRAIATGDTPATATTSGNDSTPVITETYVAEISIPANMTLTGVALFNGSVAAGNITVGLTDASGALIAAAKSASTAMAGTDAYQRIPFAAPYAAIGPATYYIQVQFSSASARYNTHTVGNFGCSKQTSQTYGTLTAVTPPTTFTTNICSIASLY